MRGIAMNDKTISYLSSLLPPSNDWASVLEKQAEIDRVPIMDKLGMNFLMQQIRIAKPKKILEIGTAIGYSALCMLEASPSASIVTIEKDETRYQQALENIKQRNKQEQIEVILGDAQEVMEQLITTDASFDFVFIDAAKGQYRRYFELADQLLTNEGIIASDNVLFKNYVAEAERASKRHKKIAEKLQEYNRFLMNHPHYTTAIVPIGDGVALSLKQDKNSTT